MHSYIDNIYIYIFYYNIISLQIDNILHSFVGVAYGAWRILIAISVDVLRRKPLRNDWCVGMMDVAKYAKHGIEFVINFLEIMPVTITPGGRLNKKDGLTRYGDSHVKDKTS